MNKINYAGLTDMRDLFKAKRKNDGEWVYGGCTYYPSYNWHPVFIIIQPVEVESRRFYRSIEVDPSTISRFTGLYDKNGDRIFEGDILDMSILKHDHSLVAVSIEHGASGFYPLHPEEEHENDRRWRSFWRDDDQEVWDAKYFTIVGNIYDEPNRANGGQSQ